MSPATAQISAHFNDGNGTGTPDSYLGTAGDGWNGAWTSGFSTGGSFTTNTVASASPLNGGGNYLNAAFTAGGSGTRGFVRRDYDSFGTVSVTQAHRIEFDFRLDSSLASFTNAADYIGIHDHTVNATDSGATSTWMIRAHGADLGAADALQWSFYNGNPSSTTFNNNFWVDTNINVVSGDVYHFIIDTDPATETYQVTVQNLTTADQFTSGALVFRSSASNTFSAGSVLHFGGSVSAASESFGFSLDSLTITPVPEPSTWALLGLAASFGLCRVVRRRIG